MYYIYGNNIVRKCLIIYVCRMIFFSCSFYVQTTELTSIALKIDLFNKPVAKKKFLNVEYINYNTIFLA